MLSLGRLRKTERAIGLGIFGCKNIWGRARSQFFRGRGLNRLKLLGDHRSAHVLLKIRLSLRLIIKGTGVIFSIAMHIAEFHLTLTLKRCKCELLLASRKTADFFWHFLLDAYSGYLANF